MMRNPPPIHTGPAASASLRGPAYPSYYAAVWVWPYTDAAPLRGAA